MASHSFFFLPSCAFVVYIPSRCVIAHIGIFSPGMAPGERRYKKRFPVVEQPPEKPTDPRSVV
jgi:hypothetical protein